MRKILLALLSFALASSVGAQSCCDSRGLKNVGASSGGMFNYPGLIPGHYINWGASGTSTGSALDASGDTDAWCGSLVILDGSTSKTITGGDPQASLSFMTGPTTMADAGTSVTIGVDDVSTATGQPTRPEGTVDVYTTFAGNAGIITSSDDSVWKSISLATGSEKTLTAGSIYCFVFDMTARAGSDSLTLTAAGQGSIPHIPAWSTDNTTPGTWVAGSVAPNVIITFDDGTIGWLFGSVIASSFTAISYNSGTGTTDEYGIIFKAPFTMVVDGLYCQAGAAASAGSEIILYETPLSSPRALATVSWNAFHTRSASTVGQTMFRISNKTLTKGSWYVVSLRPTTANNVVLSRVTLNSSAHLDAYYGQNVYEARRLDNTGIFSTSTTNLVGCGVVVSKILQ